MTRHGLATILAVALAAATLSLLGQKSETQQGARLRVDVNLARLRFTVRDSLGQLVNNLTRDDFRILQNGIPQKTVFFERPRNSSGKRGRLWLAFLLDVSGSTFATRTEEITAARTFLDNISSATQIGVFGFTDKVLTFQDFTSDRGLALKAFREARKQLGQTAIYTSLDTLMAHLQQKAAQADQKAVIVISDGLDNSYRRAAATIARARREGLVLYTILVPSAAQIYISPETGSAASQAPVNRPDPLLEEKKDAFGRLSRLTGGKHFSGFEAILNFDDALAQISDDLFGNLYSLGYYPEEFFETSRQPRIDIIVQPSGLHASLPFEELPRRLEPKKALVQALFDSRALDRLKTGFPDRFREIGAQMDILPTRREGGRIGLPFRIKISPYTFGDPERNGVNTRLGIIGMLLDSQGREVVRLREVFRVNLSPKKIRQGAGIVYANKLMAFPGSYRLRLVLIELATWRLTTFERSVRILTPPVRPQDGS